MMFLIHTTVLLSVVAVLMLVTIKEAGPVTMRQPYGFRKQSMTQGITFSRSKTLISQLENMHNGTSTIWQLYGADTNELAETIPSFAQLQPLLEEVTNITWDLMDQDQALRQQKIPFYRGFGAAKSLDCKRFSTAVEAVRIPLQQLTESQEKFLNLSDAIMQELEKANQSATREWTLREDEIIVAKVFSKISHFLTRLCPFEDLDSTSIEGCVTSRLPYTLSNYFGLTNKSTIAMLHEHTARTQRDEMDPMYKTTRMYDTLINFHNISAAANKYLRGKLFRVESYEKLFDYTDICQRHDDPCQCLDDLIDNEILDDILWNGLGSDDASRVIPVYRW